jgi:hypothetical protein
MSKFNLNLLVQFSKVLPNSKKSIEIQKEFLFELWPISDFWPSCGPPPLSPVPAHLPTGQMAFSRPTWPSPLLPHSRVGPALVSLPRSSQPSASVLRALPRLIGPPPTSRAVARSRPSALSPLTPPLLATSATPSSGNRRLFHFTVAQSPPSPSAPIKGAPATPHTALLSFSLMPELAPTTRLQSPPLWCCHPAASPTQRLW